MTREPPVQVTPTAANEKFCAWLGARFSGDESAHRITIVQLNIGNRHGETVFTHDQRPDATDGKQPSKGKPRLSREKILELSNKMIVAAQLDCDALRRSSLYAALAWHPAMGADSYSRFAFRLSPKVAYTDVDDDNVDSPSRERLLLTLLESERRDKRWMTELSVNLISGVVERQDQRIERMESIVDDAWKRQTEMMQATESMLNQSEERKQRAAWAAWKQAKIDLALEKGIALAEMLLPQLAAKALASGTNPVKVFMSSISEEQGLAAFGEFNHSTKSVAGRVFSEAQFQLLLNIADQSVPDDRMVAAFAESITQEQMAQAQEIFSMAQLGPLIAFMRARAQAAASAGSNGTVQ